MDDKTVYTPLETLQSALTYLMSRHSMITSLQLQGCPACSALSITQHLNLLLQHPELDSQVLRSTYRTLLTHWQGLIAHHEHQAALKHQAEKQQTLHIH